jgi:saccharopine dehydrogenase (NAD+, L-lysine-forming)
MAKALVVGAGAVGNVVVHKLIQRSNIFDGVLLASRTIEKCERIAARVSESIEIAQVDADDAPKLARLIRESHSQLVINAALPYQDLSIMEACLDAGVHYIDTANYETPEVARFEYRLQWGYHDAFHVRGITAVLGCGFDPGMTNAYCAYAQKHLFDRIDTVDIIDCNDGSHGRPFATNFNPEVNIREVTAPGRYYEDGEWHVTKPLSQSALFDFPGVGVRRAYLMYHEELESLARFLPGVRRLRFWMTFSDRYLTYLNVLQDLGLTRIDPVDYDGHPVVPLKLLKQLLPDPASLAEAYTGRTSIACLIRGVRGGVEREHILYNNCDHAACYKEVGSQAISYTTGVPAVAGAVMLMTGKWAQPGVFNVEQLDPDPFLLEASNLGLPWYLA